MNVWFHAMSENNMERRFRLLQDLRFDKPDRKTMLIPRGSVISVEGDSLNPRELPAPFKAFEQLLIVRLYLESRAKTENVGPNDDLMPENWQTGIVQSFFQNLIDIEALEEI